jgi:hypothetical protein
MLHRKIRICIRISMAGRETPAPSHLGKFHAMRPAKVLVLAALLKN